MTNSHIQKIITSLPLTQQVALWAICRMPGAGSNKFSFLSSEFAKLFKPITSKYISSSSEKYGKFVGATLSGLARNGILMKVIGGRDKTWALSKEMVNNFEMVKSELFEIKVYWN